MQSSIAQSAGLPFALLWLCRLVLVGGGATGCREKASGHRDVPSSRPPWQCRSTKWRSHPQGQIVRQALFGCFFVLKKVPRPAGSGEIAMDGNPTQATKLPEPKANPSKKSIFANFLCQKSPSHLGDYRYHARGAEKPAHPARGALRYWLKGFGQANE